MRNAASTALENMKVSEAKEVLQVTKVQEDIIEALGRTAKAEEDSRAVAAMSLGRTGNTDEFIIDALIRLLTDYDQIVRRSACLSLGKMKAVKAIPAIANVW